MKMRKHEDTMSHDTRIALLEQSIGHIGETLIRLEKRFDTVDNKIDALDKKIDSKTDALDQKIDAKADALDQKIDANFRDINNRLWFNFIWVVGGFIGVLTIIARLFHWF